MYKKNFRLPTNFRDEITILTLVAMVSLLENLEPQLAAAVYHTLYEGVIHGAAAHVVACRQLGAVYVGMGLDGTSLAGLRICGSLRRPLNIMFGLMHLLLVVVHVLEPIVNVIRGTWGTLRCLTLMVAPPGRGFHFRVFSCFELL